MSRLLRAACGLLASVVLVGTAAAQGGIVDGTTNTIVVDERPLGSTGCTRVTTRGDTPGGDVWTSIYLRPTTGPCGLPIATVPCPVARQPITRVLDGTTNTLYVGEAPGTWCVGNIGNGRCAVQSLPSITDGTTNTLLIGELLPPIGGPEPLECALPVGGTGCSLGATITDGTTNTLLIGYGGGGYGCLLPVAGTRDLTDVRLEPDGDICTPTPGGIVDGTSNTLIVGECVAVVATPEPSTVPLLGAGLAVLAALAGGRVRRSD